MVSNIKLLHDKKLITPPKFLVKNVHYETIIGSMAYGVNKDDSDYDVYGICIPPKDIVFPHLQGIIPEFDDSYIKFDQWQEHHIIDDSTSREYDFTVYNVVKFFKLASKCVPNIVDSLFTPTNCVLHLSRVGNIIREDRKLFLCKKIYHSYSGYAYQQLSKAKKGSNKSNPKRKKSIETYGYDAKFCYHIIRLVNQAEQMLVEGDLDLQASRKQLMSVRNGEWTFEQIEDYFESIRIKLSNLYQTSNALPEKIQKTKIKNLLLKVLEENYGSIDQCVKILDKDTTILNQIQELLKGR